MEPFVPTEKEVTRKSGDPEFIQEVDHIRNALKGEISAVEAYAQVMEKIKADPESQRLQEFLSDHRKAVDYWKSEIEHTNIKFEPGSGPWGVMVEAFVGSAKLFGNKTALMSLREGEEHGLTTYREMLASPDVLPEHKQHIRDVFIPAQQRHLNSINAMIKMQ